ncbi:hypothetical protein [Anaeromyxobacter diazotrophicus]|uniref:HEAT repeat domain-containing protein n=1 Tax=Anaeromyxobacter diazotrophicus TaxID=2590199 RepID=A0A7I9VRU6_9BACT|nr:hypothetical protein [Anaeromyxobacter diazotrophicus]GEJ59153.1 hypothetical protein AMYX_38940 [Anaeromyxobacter diazotrophicus]
MAPVRSPPAAVPAERPAASPVAQAAAGVLLALSRAARSFVLYDAGNAVVRQLLADYRDRARDALSAFGALAIEVRPFELAVAGEVVYREPDREKSLAFRLFRDGVRRLTLQPSVSWDELLQLLQILAVRYTAVRQQEEDIVTLLRKAEFGGITIEAVEGFTPSEENPEPELDEQAQRAARAQPPAGWDTPLPRLPQPAPIAFREVPEAELAALRAQASDEQEAVAELALSLARDLLAEASRAGWPLPNPDLSAFFAELRDALLADGELESLRRLIDLIGDTGGGELREATLRGLGDARTLDLVLASVPEDAAQLPPALVPFLPLLGIEAALDRLLPDAGTSEPRQRLLLRIVLARLPREADAVLARLSAFDPRLARELARGIVARAPERASEVARQLLGQQDAALRLEGLAALERASGAFPLRPVCDLLTDPALPVRVRAAELLGRHGDAAVLEPLRAQLEGKRELPPEEAEALGRALAQVSPIFAGRLFAGWLDPKARFLRGLSAQQRTLQWAAVAGEGELPGPEAEALLAGLAERGEPELRRHCLAVLARRRKGAGHAGAP